MLHDLSAQIVGLSELRSQCGIEPSNDYSDRSYEQDFSAFSQLMLNAFSCDLSRVCTLHMGQLSGQQVTGQTIDLHNDYAHSVWLNQNSQAVMTQ